MGKKKKTIVEEEKPKFPAVILGLDISTACIGASVILDDGVNKPIIQYITHIVPKVSKKKTGIEALILRKEIFEKEFLSKIAHMGITECVIESPITHISNGKSSAHTIAQLLQFNGLLSEAVYNILGLVPSFVSSYDARMLSFPQLLAIRKFNKKGEIYNLQHVKKALDKNHIVLFGSYPFDCDKKSIMMDMVNECYPDIDWVKDKKGELKKENYDACDSLVCALAHSNIMRHGEINPSITKYSINESNGTANIEYTFDVWGKKYNKKLTLSTV